MRHLRILCLGLALAISISFGFVNAHGATNTETRFASAQLTQRIASALQSETIPAEIKSSLLDSARSEDKDFAKSMVLNWKKFRDVDVHAEFDQLVVLDEESNEILRMRPLEPAQTFEINGRIWTAPPTGSISQSLRAHLEFRGEDSAAAGSFSRSKSVSIFFLPSIRSAVAAPRSQLSALAPAYLFATGVKSRKEKSDQPNDQPASTIEALTEKSPAKYVANEVALLDYLSAVLNVDVQCNGGSARGNAKLFHNRFVFESRVDGSLVFTMEDGTKLLVTSTTIDQRRLSAERQAELSAFLISRNETAAKKIFQDFMARTEAINGADRIHRRTAAALRSSMERLSRTGQYTEAVSRFSKELSEFYKSRARLVVTEEMTTAKCTNASCSTIESATQRTTIQPWMLPDNQQHIQNALKWKPTDLASSSKAKIIRTDTTGVPVFSLDENSGKLTKRDMERAEHMITEARRAAARSHAIVRNLMSSLRPLGACCNEKACRAALLKQNINLVPNKSKAVDK